MLISLINRLDETLPLSPTPLHQAAAFRLPEVAQRLIREGADLESIDATGCTPLHHAVINGNMHMVRILLDAGSFVSPRDYADRTPLWYACNSGFLEIIDALIDCGSSLQEMAVETDKQKVETPLFGSRLSVIGSRLFGVLFNDDGGWHKLDRADKWFFPAYLLLTGHPSQFLWMLHKGVEVLRPLELEWPKSLVDSMPPELVGLLAKRLRILGPFIADDEMNALLGHQTSGQHGILCQAARRGYQEAQGLIDAGASIEHACETHGTPLVAAFSMGQMETVKHLVRLGAQILLDDRQATGSRFRQIVDWILVTRYTEQPKLSGTAHGPENRPIASKKAGVVAVAVPLKWEWRKGRRESRLEYAVRRHRILKDLRGTIVKPLDS